MPKVAYVYSGDGASQRCILSTIESLKVMLKGVQIHQLCSLDLLEGGWQESAVLLCFPGGADLPYCQFLNGDGNKMIIDYVRSGGAYLGMCAGGYYACSRIEFEKGRHVEVCGLRELSFFPGLAKGAVQPGFEYDTEGGTAAVPIRFREQGKAEEWCECQDYSNGGPCFIADSDHSQAVDIIAEYIMDDPAGTNEGPKAAAVRCQVGEGVTVLCGTHPELSPRWLEANCSVSYIRRTQPHLNQEQVKHLVQNSVKVKAALTKDQRKRERLMKQILIAAGLKDHLKDGLPSDCTNPLLKRLISRKSV